MKHLLAIVAVLSLVGCATMDDSSKQHMTKGDKGCYDFTAVYQGDGKERTHTICDGKSGGTWNS